MLSKIMSLADAVHEYVRPGMSIHLAYGGGRPNAIVSEIVGQFHGSSPGFIVSAHCFVGTQHALIGAGLVDHLVTAYAGEDYPTPRPNPVLQRAIRSGAVTIENWSLWTLTARLIAGALCLPHFPVQSLAGSGLADEHEGVGYTTASVFGTETGAVAPYRPDITLVHGLVADSMGNVILAAPYGEGAWGAMAARQGVIATVERIVDSDFIRSNNSLPMIPGHVVRAVSEVPFGSHPYGIQSGGLAGIQSYVEDGVYMAEAMNAAKDPDAFASWIDAQILSHDDHAALIDSLGAERVSLLTGPRVSAPPTSNGSPNEDERMTLVAARVLRDRIHAARHRVVLAGMGHAHLAAWTAVSRLKSRGVAVELAAELGMSGFLPQPDHPHPFAVQNLATSLQLTDVRTVVGRDTTAGNAISTIGILGASAVDAAGDINSTWSPDGDFVVGSGGANDVASAADEVIVIVKHGLDRMVEKVGYITAPGRRVSTIVTSEAVLERRADRFVVTRWMHRGVDAARVRALTGWPLDIADDVSVEPPSDPRDIAVLRGFDPQGLVLRS